LTPRSGRLRSTLDERQIVSRHSDKVVPNQAIAAVPNQTIVLSRECDTLIGHVVASIRGMERAQEARLSDPTDGALAVIGACHMLGGSGSGAAEGMLVASALNMLTTRTKVTTVICVQAAGAELFVRHTNLTPDALRIHLSPVFVALRRSTDQPPSRAQPVAEVQADDVISKLATLSGLLDRGLIDRTEFDRLKAQALSEPSTEQS
jgi:hypothetical protein